MGTKLGPDEDRTCHLPIGTVINPLRQDAESGCYVLIRDVDGALTVTRTRSRPFKLASGGWVVSIDGHPDNHLALDQIWGELPK